MMTEEDIQAWVGRTLIDPPADITCERGYILHWLEATENANPLYWDDDVARSVSGGPIAPPSMLSAWMRPLMFVPGRTETRRPLDLHFQLKEALDLPEGVVSSTEMTLGTPVRPGDRVTTRQSIREISDVKSNKLGTGRYWTIDVTYSNQRGDVVGVESYAMFAYKREPS